MRCVIHELTSPHRFIKFLTGLGHSEMGICAIEQPTYRTKSIGAML